MGFLHALAIVASLTLMSLCSAVLVATQNPVRANKRTIVEQTIHDFCASYDGVYLNKERPSWTFRGCREYTPKPNTDEKGKIHMEMLAQHDSSCGTQIVPYNRTASKAAFGTGLASCSSDLRDGMDASVLEGRLVVFKANQILGVRASKVQSGCLIDLGYVDS
ncbi:hypothetical protein D0864_01656 [Hortaea werneckii]|uniref:Ecp2 effector protein domain-containing protein n=1 Tax=Hortaea werneckii TaxID=91943 RepID=A0A3M7H6D6_HORWE|nr:hypothetical protein D0864_01656 [Hortaea werneckii]